MPHMFYTVEDARKAARRRMPRMIFDYVDGAAGDEIACARNSRSLDELQLQPRVLVNVEGRVLSKSFLGRQWDLPFGIAPMGMCNLSWPGGDAMLARAAVAHNIPLCLSTMASSDIETTRERAGENAWFQLYVGQSEEIAFDMVQRAEECGYTNLILTVDVPMVAARPREQRNGFQSPLRIGPRQFFDFATHPRWSLTTLLTGVPEVANNKRSNTGQEFVRNESRGKVDWQFLARLRERWKGNLIVKGVLSVEDAVRIRDAGVDALYVSNHGGRQLDSAPASIAVLPAMRAALGADYPIILDSGFRNGEAIVKALARGADFVMLGRPLLYAMGGAGEKGLASILSMFERQLDTTLAQIACTNVADLDHRVLHDPERAA